MINDQVFYTKAPLAKGFELSPGNTESCDSPRDIQPITEKETVSTLRNIPTPHSVFREGHHSFAPFPDSRSWAFEPGAITPSGSRTRIYTEQSQNKCQILNKNANNYGSFFISPLYVYTKHYNGLVSLFNQACSHELFSNSPLSKLQIFL